MESVAKFLSCDWGTSSFRLRLVDTADFRVLAEKESKEGNASIFESWNKSGRPDDQRFPFYLSVISEHIKALESESGQYLDGVPLIISGMASSTIGMVELPYKELPFQIDGSDLRSETFNTSREFPHEVVLISGVKSITDVMRGEETQLVGSMIGQKSEELLFIHPGTHSKHVTILNGKAVAFKTYMTGELFSLLSKDSILAGSVVAANEFSHPDHLASFREGVKDGLNGNLLNQLFTIRTNDLFNRLTPQQNYYYLSGLLIGSELKDFPRNFKGNMIMAGEDVLSALYLEALTLLGIDRQTTDLLVKNADEVTIKGQFQIFTNRRP
jgi:2-dehydro-3-deoxygalactonokinase